MDINRVFHKPDQPFHVQGFAMADGSFKVVSTDNSGHKINGTATVYSEYNQPLFEKDLRAGTIRFTYPMSYSFVKVKVTSESGEESQGTFWRTQIISPH